MFAHQRIYLLLVTFTLIVYTHQQVKDPAIVAAFSAAQKDCAKEGGLDGAVIAKMWVDNHFPNDEKVKCYFKCVNMKLGIVNDKGEVVDDVLQKVSAVFNDAATDTEITVECGGIEGTDLCDTSYKLAGCVRAAQLD